MEEDMKLLQRCRRAWNALAGFRQNRRRYKDFAYGRQWEDTALMANGRTVSERQMLLEQGRTPITNNLIRQLLKNIVGRYRYLTAPEPDAAGEVSENIRSALAAPNPLADLDARTLEEFLISGCACQRLPLKGEGRRKAAEAVSPDRLFFEPFDEADGSDCRFIGLLHDMPVAEIVTRFCHDDPQQLDGLMHLLGEEGRPSLEEAFFGRGTTFGAAAFEGRRRLIEVWELRSEAVLRCHDRNDGSLVEGLYRRTALVKIDDENRRRKQDGRKPIVASAAMKDTWVQTWLTPEGSVLERREWGSAQGPNIIVALYPMIDGEVHSLVEDVVSQQKYVNRLVTLLDDVMSSSAKGVLLYPSDQLPPGLSWAELRRLWSMPGSIVPFRRTSKHVTPRQVTSAGTLAGASEMLKMQLRLFDEISGTAEAMRLSSGSSGTAGAEAMRRQSDHASLSMLDVLAAFRAFTSRRDRALASS